MKKVINLKLCQLKGSSQDEVGGKKLMMAPLFLLISVFNARNLTKNSISNGTVRTAGSQ